MTRKRNAPKTFYVIRNGNLYGTGGAKMRRSGWTATGFIDCDRTHCRSEFEKLTGLRLKHRQRVAVRLKLMSRPKVLAAVRADADF
jgi:hypothetical protein